MTLVKWRRPLENGQVNRNAMYNSPLSGLFNNIWRDEFLTNEYAQFVPAVNLSEEEGQYVVELSAPGFDKNDFKIEVNAGILTVSGKHETEKEVKEKNYTRKEFNYGSFQRSFSLPEEINEEAIDAKYENGILKMALPKKEEVKKAAKEIKVS
ncbi:MAG TPA: Hsp20/alpha crystallin family protein [Bacteroidia bacterium]|nr:Hsp20/alpha crystallin family protein [Bacteroidia bacterium]